jgi:hypothetical protein
VISLPSDIARRGGLCASWAFLVHGSKKKKKKPWADFFVFLSSCLHPLTRLLPAFYGFPPTSWRRHAALHTWCWFAGLDVSELGGVSVSVSISVSSSASDPDSCRLDLDMYDCDVLDVVRSRLYALSVVDCTPL